MEGLPLTKLFRECNGGVNDGAVDVDRCPHHAHVALYGWEQDQRHAEREENPEQLQPDLWRLMTS